MKILIDHHQPFRLAHGGLQIQIEQTHDALRQIGVEAEYLHWWDDRQPGDLIHYFGRVEPVYLRRARAKGTPVVMSELLTGLGSRGTRARQVQRLVTRGMERFAPGFITERMLWESFREADAVVALTSWEARLMREMFRTPAARLHIIPNGVEDVFLRGTPAAERGEWLVCTAIVTERKRPLELARAAVAAQVPVWVVGKPYSENDPYFHEFLTVARAHPRWVRYEGAISDRAEMARIYREARGFVLLSTMESLSLSALEAAACGCPLLLSDLPWARSTFGDNARYCPITSETETTAAVLKAFHAAAPTLPSPPPPLSWREVAEQLRSLYETLLRNRPSASS